MDVRDWDLFQRDLEDVEVFVEDVCLEIDVDGAVEVIEDLPGKVWFEDGGEEIDIDWDFLSRHPAIEDEVIYHQNLVSEIDAADRYTRRAEQGFSDQ